MLSWISANLGTLFVTLLLLGAVLCALAVLRRDKKKGVSPCGGNCAHCPMGGACHKQ